VSLVVQYVYPKLFLGVTPPWREFLNELEGGILVALDTFAITIRIWRQLPAEPAPLAVAAVDSGKTLSQGGLRVLRWRPSSHSSSKGATTERLTTERLMTEQLTTEQLTTEQLTTEQLTT